MRAEIPTIVARSLPEANLDIIRLGPRAAIVSIGEPGREPPYGFQAANPLHVRLEFYDILAPVISHGKTLRPASREDIAHLLKRALILRTAQHIYCHCNGGISRSPAAAYILRCLWWGPGHEEEAMKEVMADRSMAAPNRIMIAHADRLLSRDGAMLEEIDLGP